MAKSRPSLAADTTTVDRQALTAKRWARLKPEPEQVPYAQRRIDLKPVKRVQCDADSCWRLDPMAHGVGGGRKLVETIDMMHAR